MLPRIFCISVAAFFSPLHLLGASKGGHAWKFIKVRKKLTWLIDFFISILRNFKQLSKWLGWVNAIPWYSERFIECERQKARMRKWGNERQMRDKTVAALQGALKVPLCGMLQTLSQGFHNTLWSSHCLVPASSRVTPHTHSCLLPLALNETRKSVSRESKAGSGAKNN